jgi:hypothetical protein
MNTFYIWRNCISSWWSGWSSKLTLFKQFTATEVTKGANHKSIVSFSNYRIFVTTPTSTHVPLI